MKKLRPLAILFGTTAALGFLANASAAERLQSVIQRAAAPQAQATTNVPKTFRLTGTAVDADGKPVGGAVVECYQYGGSGTPIAGKDMEVRQHLTTETNGAFEFQVLPASTIVLGRKPGLAFAWAQYLEFDQRHDGPALGLHAAHDAHRGSG